MKKSNNYIGRYSFDYGQSYDEIKGVNYHILRDELLRTVRANSTEDTDVEFYIAKLFRQEEKDNAGYIGEIIEKGTLQNNRIVTKKLFHKPLIR